MERCYALAAGVQDCGVNLICWLVPQPSRVRQGMVGVFPGGCNGLGGGNDSCGVLKPGEEEAG